MVKRGMHHARYEKDYKYDDNQCTFDAKFGKACADLCNKKQTAYMSLVPVPIGDIKHLLSTTGCTPVALGDGSTTQPLMHNFMIQALTSDALDTMYLMCPSDDDGHIRVLLPFSAQARHGEKDRGLCAGQLIALPDTDVACENYAAMSRVFHGTPLHTQKWSNNQLVNFQFVYRTRSRGNDCHEAEDEDDATSLDDTHDDTADHFDPYATISSFSAVTASHRRPNLTKKTETNSQPGDSKDQTTRYATVDAQTLANQANVDTTASALKVDKEDEVPVKENEATPEVTPIFTSTHTQSLNKVLRRAEPLKLDGSDDATESANQNSLSSPVKETVAGAPEAYKEASEVTQKFTFARDNIKPLWTRKTAEPRSMTSRDDQLAHQAAFLRRVQEARQRARNTPMYDPNLFD